LGNNSILAYLGFGSRRDSGNHPDAQIHFECNAGRIRGSQYIFFLANRTSQYESNNYLWWEDYVRTCRASGVDFVSSWSWSRGAAGTFESRIVDLANGGVSLGENIITLQDVQNACGTRVLPTPPPGSSPTPPGGQLPTPTPVRGTYNFPLAQLFDFSPRLSDLESVFENVVR